MEQIIGENAPAMKMAVPGLSIKVEGIKGPIAEGELPKCEGFGAKIASQLTPLTRANAALSKHEL